MVLIGAPRGLNLQAGQPDSGPNTPKFRDGPLNAGEEMRMMMLKTVLQGKLSDLGWDAATHAPSLTVP